MYLFADPERAQISPLPLNFHLYIIAYLYIIISLPYFFAILSPSQKSFWIRP